MIHRQILVAMCTILLLVLIPVTVNAAKVVAVSAGYSHVLALNDDGTLLSWGKNLYGELGMGVEGNVTAQLCFKTPQKVFIDNVTAISAGHLVSYALKKDGTVWAWGWGDYGMLGYGGNVSQCIPVQVKGLTDVIAIAAGNTASLALKNDGTVWAWGASNVGDSTSDERLIPVQVTGLSDIVALGERGNYAIKNAGTVYAWGENTYSIGPDGVTFGAIGDTSGPGIRPTPFQVQGLSNVTMITCGMDQTIYIREDGSVWAWGSILHGNLGNGEIKTSRPEVVRLPSVRTQIGDVRDVSSSTDHCVALKNDGTVWFWGNFIDDRIISGDDGEPTPVKIEGLDHVIDVSTGGSAGIVLKDDGSVWGWGHNRDGQLGNNRENAPNPVLILPGPVQATPTATVKPGDANGTPATNASLPDPTGQSGISIPGMDAEIVLIAIATAIGADKIICRLKKKN